MSLVTLKRKKTCERTVKNKPEPLEFVPDYLKTQKMFEKIVEKNNWCLEFVPDHFNRKKHV